MKVILSAMFVIISMVTTSAQTKTTQSLDEKYEGLSLYFYRNTLRMLNQTEDKSFDELIKDIEKMRFLMIDKQKATFSKDDYKKLLTSYKGESYEEIMTGRYDGKNFDIYLKENGGEVKGTVMLMNDSTSLIVLDILGKVALDKASQLFEQIDKSTEIGNKIKSFTERNSASDKKKEKDHNKND